MRASASALSDLNDMKKGMKKTNLNSLENNLLDSFKFSSALFNSMIFSRKEMIRPVIPSPYNQICNNTVSSENNDFLFGPDLVENIKKTTDQKKLLEHLKPKNRTESRPSGPSTHQNHRGHQQRNSFPLRSQNQNQRGGFQQKSQQFHHSKPQQTKPFSWYEDANIFKPPYPPKNQKQNTWNTKGRDPPQKRY